MLPLQFGIPGGPELLVILLIAVLLFGANKIPKLARSTGEAMGEFQKGREEVEQELQEMRDGPTADDGSLEADEEPTVEAATTAGETTAGGAETTADGDASVEDAEIEDAEIEDAEIEDAEIEDAEIEDAEANEETN